MSKLNPEQRAAVLHGDGPLLVLAGAGTGKTRVLVHRIAHLVETRGEPWAILAVTFTKKAAEEMRQRLRQLLGGVADAMWIGTFHATCARLLRKWPEVVGLTKSFTIFDDDDQMRLVGRLIKEAKIEEYVTPRTILSRIDRAKNRGVDPMSEQSGLFTDEHFALIYPQYEAQLAKENAVDFNDLLLKTIALTDDPTVGPRVRGMFRHVLVDEFQDTNMVQYRLVGQLSAATRNLTVVGDDDQAIYGWRGANPRNLLDFDRDYADATIIKLEQNYRSTQIVLDAANAVIARNRERHLKALWTAQAGGDLIEQYTAGDERGEASWIAAAIKRLLDEGPYSPNDFAVLYRTNAQSRVLEEFMRAYRVPAKVIGDVSFFERKEVKDVLAYLRLMVNPAADSAFERIVNVPTRGIGDASVERLRAAARAQHCGMLAVARTAGQGGVTAITGAARKKLAAFVELIDGLTAVVADGASVAEAIIQVVERSGMRAKLEAEDTEESRGRLSNLAELVTMASDFDDDRVQSGAHADGEAGPLTADTSPIAAEREAAPATIEEFLENLALAQAADQTAGATHVSLMTIHIAKGLEYPVVFLAGMEDGLFPSLREREDGDAERQLEEERRLAYVAITRAKERLVTTWARTRRVWGEIRFCMPSRFLDELPGHCVAQAPAARRDLNLGPTPSPAKPVGDGSRASGIAVTRRSGGLGNSRTAMGRGNYGGYARSAAAVDADEFAQPSYDDVPAIDVGDADVACSETALRAVASLPHSRSVAAARGMQAWQANGGDVAALRPVDAPSATSGGRFVNAPRPTSAWSDDAEADPVVTIGARVSHAAFGIGRVVESSGEGRDQKAVVDFAAVGEKTVLVRYLTVRSP